MKRICRNFYLALLFVLVAATGAMAQEVKGRFTLPFEANWGGAVLQPGEYTFRFNTADSNILMLQHDGRTVYVKLGYTDTTKKDGRPDELVTVSYDQHPSINELYVADLKTSFYFPISKYYVSTQIIARGGAPENVAHVPVQISR